MSEKPRKTELPRRNFRWSGDLLEQEVQIIRHYDDDGKGVRLETVWMPVLVGEVQVFRRPSEKSKGMPSTIAEIQRQGPKPGRFVIECDGGTSCNSPRNYGVGYGSYKINDEDVVRVEFGKGHSNNSAEIRILAAALAALSAKVDPAQTSVLARSDSKIALKWVRQGGQPKEGTSEGFKEAIGILRVEVAKFRSVKTEWRGRNHSVALFGH